MAGDKDLFDHPHTPTEARWLPMSEIKTKCDMLEIWDGFEG